MGHLFRSGNVRQKSGMILFFTILMTSWGYGQEEAAWPQNFFSGYSASVRGGNFSYHSPESNGSTSLLVRSDDANNYIEWSSETVSLQAGQREVCLAWMFGIDADAEKHEFRMTLNGEELLTFSNPVEATKESRSFRGTDGSMLTFQTTMIDRYSDAMGYAFITLPASKIRNGKPQVIRVTGENSGRRTWYMTFETVVKEKTDISQEEALMMTGKHLSTPVNFRFIHLGEPEKAVIRIPGIESRNVELQPGMNIFRFAMPSVEKPREYTSTVSFEGGKTGKHKFTLRPVKQWTIYLVQHSHTDIGYTRPQTEILAEHLRYIDFALDFCDQTDTLPAEAQFRWTCETSFPVREYLRSRPAYQVERLLKRIREGRIEVAGMFLNLSDLADEATLADQLAPLSELRSQGLPVSTAMQDDVNGVGWALSDYLPGAGIRYLTMGQNTARALKPFQIPNAFWWKSPSGNRILTWCGEHYMKGNELGILSADAEKFGKELFSYLQYLAEHGYPFDRISLQFSGYQTDNSPPSTTACRLIQQWNEMYAWPKLKLATAHEFPEYLEKNHAQQLQAIRGAWPDWWTDGFGSAALETSYTRQAHTDFLATQGLLSMASLMGAKLPDASLSKLEEISDNLVFYDEHTFGAAESITDPLAENSVVQWGEKSAYTWEAVKQNRMLQETAMGLVQPYLPRKENPALVVFNTLNTPRSGIVRVYIDHQVLPPGRSFSFSDGKGSIIPAQQLESRADGTYWAIYAKDVPPLGYQTYELKVKGEHETNAVLPVFNGKLENDHYILGIDTVRGSIEFLFDKELKTNLLNTNKKWQAGQFIYERLGNNRAQLEQLRLDTFTREVWSKLKVTRVINGPVWSGVELTGQLPGCADPTGIRMEIRLFKTEKNIELVYSMKKLPVTAPEAVYVAFLFQLNEGKLVWEANGGEVLQGRDQVPGSSADWTGLQNYAAVRNEQAQVVWVSHQVPLAMLGGLNLGKFDRIAKAESTALYSWVLNNYWTTNFRASQEGELKWSYNLTSSTDTSGDFATRYAWGKRVPMLTRIIPSGIPSGNPGEFSLIDGSWKNVLLIRSKPDKTGGIVLQLRETGGKNTPVNLASLLKSTRIKEITEVDATGQVIRPLTMEVIFKPLEVKFIRISP